MKHKILQYDPQLQPYEAAFDARQENFRKKTARLLSPGQTLSDFANGHAYFGFHENDGGWYYREGNGWSYHYSRRQWSLADDPNLKYKYLLAFEKDMVKTIKSVRALQGKDTQLALDNEEKTLSYRKGKAVFSFNFHPTRSCEDCRIPVPEPGEYSVVMSTDDLCYGGQGRIWHQSYQTEIIEGRPTVRLYLPCRTAVVLKKK